jgi:hypothetical protein
MVGSTSSLTICQILPGTDYFVDFDVHAVLPVKLEIFSVLMIKALAIGYL